MLVCYCLGTNHSPRLMKANHTCSIWINGSRYVLYTHVINIYHEFHCCCIHTYVCTYTCSHSSTGQTKFDVVMQPKQKYFMCCSFEGNSTPHSPTRMPAYLPLLHLGVEHSSRTVSIIVVDTALCLLEDNYFQWPMSKLGHVSHTGMYTPPYKLIAKKSVTDISSVVSMMSLYYVVCMYLCCTYCNIRTYNVLWSNCYINLCYLVCSP